MDRATLDAAWRAALRSRTKGTPSNEPDHPGETGTEYVIPFGPRRIGVYVAGKQWHPRTPTPRAQLQRSEIEAIQRLLTPWSDGRPLNDEERSDLAFVIRGVVNGRFW